MSARRPALGRGLSALIPNTAPTPTAAAGNPAKPTQLPISALIASRVQPRTQFADKALEELAASIKANGILQPILVREGEQKGRYFIIAGERRYRASQLAGLRTVPVVVRDATEAHAYELALVENIQRQDLGVIEEALAYRHLIDHYGMTQDAVATRVGKDRATVANAVRLLKLPTAIQDLLADGQLTAGHARAILSAPEPLRAQLAQQAIAEGWSVRETERQAKSAQPPVETDAELTTDETPPPVKAPADRAVEDQLRAALGAPVKLTQKAGKGRIEVRFHSLDELERLIDLIGQLEGR